MARTALITGATSGIGRAAAVRFAAGGWHVVAVGRREDRLAALRAKCGPRVVGLAVDLRDSEAVRVGLAEFSEHLQALDLLVNNAALPQRTRLLDTPADEIEALIDTNVRAVVGLTRALLPRLVERRGAILSISSTAARYPTGGSVVYSGSKAFVTHFSQALRADLRGTGVRVTVLEPGYVATEMMQAGEERQPRTGPVLIDPADLADVMFYLAQLPPSVNVNRMEIMPTSQTVGNYHMSVGE
jgi:serine 3-dehydrogenase